MIAALTNSRLKPLQELTASNKDSRPRCYHLFLIVQGLQKANFYQSSTTPKLMSTLSCRWKQYTRWQGAQPAVWTLFNSVRRSHCRLLEVSTAFVLILPSWHYCPRMVVFRGRLFPKRLADCRVKSGSRRFSTDHIAGIERPLTTYHNG